MYDVIIIGAGVIGSAVARELSRYTLRTLVLEKENDVCCGTSKANSAIVHAGFDARPHTLKGTLNAKSNLLFDQLATELDIPFKRNGALVLCFDENNHSALLELKERGKQNGVPNLQILTRAEALALEPNLSHEVVSALYAPSSGITCPFTLTLALAENAFTNGVGFKFNSPVTSIVKENDSFFVHTPTQTYQTRIVVNAVGVFSDVFNNSVSAHAFTITPVKGEYDLFDKYVGHLVSHTLFQLPTPLGKGVLVTPTIDGNLLIGPNATPCEDKDNVETTRLGLDEILSKATHTITSIPMHYVITSFSGLRAHCDRDDFIIGEAPDVPNFFNALGIESPGLSCAPLIGKQLARAICDKLIPLPNPLFNPQRKGIVHFNSLPTDKQQRLIKENPLYGKVICRCESVTEAEIVDALTRPLGATDLDGIKRRTRAGAGRCQSGFCYIKNCELLSKERNIPSLPPPSIPALNESYDLIIIGGGPAGLGAALAAHKKGIKRLLILEREAYLGGILIQCIHNGFGLHTFKEELTGPEYAERFIRQVQKASIPYLLNTMVTTITPDKVVHALNPSLGVITLKAQAIILAMGCRERPRGALTIPGARCKGILTAGTAQKLVNMKGIIPGKEVVVLGSGDIGLIMARRMTLEGAHVQAVIELMPYSSGLKRNIVQCLDDYGIPLKLNHTVIQIHGKKQLEGVTIAEVDANKQPIPSTATFIPCDLLLLSVGLLPENELSHQAHVPLSSITGGPIVNHALETKQSGIFACGNVLHVHDLVDYVSEESALAGEKAAEYIQHTQAKAPSICVSTENGVRYCVPQYISTNLDAPLTLRFRVDQVYKNAYKCLYFDDILILRKKKRIFTPGEMESLFITPDLLKAHPHITSITVKIERS